MVVIQTKPLDCDPNDQYVSPVGYLGLMLQRWDGCDKLNLPEPLTVQIWKKYVVLSTPGGESLKLSYREAKWLGVGRTHNLECKS